ncbi:hypothetical protein AX15_007506 [Amanita polypyramis BW_CC]|nr:hypothetical protein AX15_007506 [Amanita polypyramis BW_CC]
MSTEKGTQQSLSLEDESSHSQVFDWWTNKLLAWGVESRGIRPVPIEERTDTQTIKIFFVWFSANINVLSFSSGTLGPAVFNLGLRDSCLCILFFNLLCYIPPAYFAIWGAKLGMRQMIVSRYSFGFYGVIIPCILDLIGLCGYCILDSILGGQTLASVTNGHLTWTYVQSPIDVLLLTYELALGLLSLLFCRYWYEVGVVLILLVLTHQVSFCGVKVLVWYERVAWIPVAIAFLVATGVGGKYFSSPAASARGTAASILSFASTIAGYAISYSPLSADFTTYFHPEVPSWKLFWCAYLGFLLSTVPLQVLGAAAAIASTYVTSWGDSYEGGNVGGLLAAMLGPTKGFGKFLTVLLSLSVVGNITATFYSISICLQVLLPFLVVVPRYVFSVVAIAIVLPISIAGAHKFYEALTNFLGIIGYWTSAYAGIIIMEHLIFRRNDYERYDVRQWDKARKLPSGIAALGAGIFSIGLIVPCMSQVWYTGPIAKMTGDIGFEVAFVLGSILYVAFRALEIRMLKA